MRNVFDNFALPDPNGVALSFQRGLEHGRAQREEREVKGALSAYAVDPDSPAAFETLARYRPELAIQIRQDRSKRDQAAQVADLQRRAAGGDRGAMAELAGVDLDAWDKLHDNHRQDTQDRVGAIGEAALRISQLPAERRPAAWDAAVGQLSQRWPELAEFQGRYSEDALNSALDTAGKAKEFFDLSRPSYQAIPEGGTLVNTRDPAAVASFSSSAGALAADIPIVANPEEAKRLAPGTQFRTPDGRTMRVPGGAASNGSGNFPTGR